MNGPTLVLHLPFDPQQVTKRAQTLIPLGFWHINILPPPLQLSTTSSRNNTNQLPTTIRPHMMASSTIPGKITDRKHFVPRAHAQGNFSREQDLAVKA
jgi:hypothetical protein